MEKNVGNLEAIVRGVIGAGFLALGVGQRNPIWIGLSLLTFVNAVTQSCPINRLLGVDTYGEHGEGAPEHVQAPTIH